MPISCHFRDCKALLVIVYSRNQRYSKHPDLQLYIYIVSFLHTTYNIQPIYEIFSSKYFLFFTTPDYFSR